MAANRTVLEFTQDILAYMEADLVNDISETEESEMVVTILRNTFYDLADEFEFPHKFGILQLTATDASTPTHMELPSGVSRVDGVWYDKLDSASDPTNYEPVYYADPKRFMQLINSRNSSDSNIEKVTHSSGVTLLIKNDENPRWWTSFDDETLIFDSYDSNLDSFLQNSKTWVNGWTRPTFTVSNSHKPDIPQHMEQYYFNEAASLAFTTLKQSANQKVEQRAQQSKRSTLNTYRRLGNKVKTPNYGRK